MNDSWDFSGPALPGAYFSSATSSFTDFLRAQAPELLPGRRVPANAANLGVPHGTTIVALTYAGGVLIAIYSLAGLRDVCLGREPHAAPGH